MWLAINLSAAQINAMCWDNTDLPQGSASSVTGLWELGRAPFSVSLYLADTGCMDNGNFSSTCFQVSKAWHSMRITGLEAMYASTFYSVRRK